ncbi:MAG: hypothetical protein ACK4YP_07010 [Myxococcota bacterium]
MAQANDLVLYLVLSPEFGGTRFGPFEGLEARLGSSKERCHITLPESLGVAKEHCKVIRQGGASMILAPSERTAAVYLWKGDARRPVQVQTPTAVKPGDSFALVTPEGPRFFIELGELPAELKAARSGPKRGPKNLTAGKFADAGKDLLLARLYTLSPVSLAMRALYFVKSGAIWQPRILLLGAIMAFGYLSSCGTGIGMLSFRGKAKAAEAAAATCREDLAYAGNVASDVEEQAFDELVGTILASRGIGLSLKKDTTFVGMVKQQTTKILESREQYAWLYEDSGRVEEFAKWRERVEKSDAFDADTKKLLPFLAATRSRVQGKWDRLLDAKETEVCGRGPVRLTYRQGKNLGLSAVALDAYVAGDATSIAQDEVARTKLLSKTAEANGEPPLDTNVPSAAEVVRQGEHTCVRADGDDDRENLSKVLSALEDQLGKKAKFVPDVDANFGAMARIAKFFAADIPGAKFAEVKKSPIDFTRGSPLTALDDVAGGQWVAERTAELVARAIVLPCDAALKHKAKPSTEATFGALPKPIPCLVMNFNLTNE